MTFVSLDLFLCALETIVNGFAILIYPSTHSLLTYRKGTNFCTFILDLATFLKVLIRFKNFLVGSQEYVKWRTTSSANDNLNSHLFVSFWFSLSPYCSSQDLKTLVKLEWKMHITFLVPNFKENNLNFWYFLQIL